MRVVGGQLRGRTLAAPGGSDRTRPTSDRVREAIFNILAHGAAALEISGSRVIDLFAGTGALGIEAVSRGAAFCLFVETDAEARGAIRHNIETFSLTGITRIFRRDATDLGPIGNMEPFQLAFLDPPYNRGLGEKALAALAEGKWLVDGAVVVLEESAQASIAVPAGFESIAERAWGDTQVVFLKRVTSAL